MPTFKTSPKFHVATYFSNKDRCWLHININILYSEKKKNKNTTKRPTSIVQCTNQFMLRCLLFLLKTLCSRGLANLLDTMHLSSIAEWITTLVVIYIYKKKNKVGEEKNKEMENSLVSLPPSLCRNFMPLISSFFNNQGLFHYCLLNDRLYLSFVQFQPTALFLWLSFAFCAVSFS